MHKLIKIQTEYRNLIKNTCCNHNNHIAGHELLICQEFLLIFIKTITKAGWYFDNIDQRDIWLISISKYGIENNKLYIC